MQGGGGERIRCEAKGKETEPEGDGIEGERAEIGECAKRLDMPDGCSWPGSEELARGKEAQRGDGEARWRVFSISSAEGARGEAQP